MKTGTTVPVFNADTGQALSLQIERSPRNLWEGVVSLAMTVLFQPFPECVIHAGLPALAGGSEG